jgi:hypothetical protein
MPDDTVTAISVFNDYGGAEESNRRTLAWIEKNLTRWASYSDCWAGDRAYLGIVMHLDSLNARCGSFGPPPSRYLQWDRYCERILVILVLAILTPPAQARQTERARTQFDCTTTKVIMTNKAGQTNSVQVEEHMTFWIDDAAKTFIFSDGRRLRVTRFDKSWISASSEDIQYEFNRADRTLTYAGSTTKDSVTTTL